MSFLKNFLIEEDGQDMVEYGLVLALVVLAAVAALTTFKGTVVTGLGAIGNKVTTNVQ